MSIEADRVHLGGTARNLHIFERIKFAPGEARAVAWAWLYVFAVFLAYYVLRPIRDELGVSGGVDKLPWLFTGTLIAMLSVNPLFAYAVKKLPRTKFIPVAYRFFMANLLVFICALKLAGSEYEIWVGRAFFIWTSVFNLFVVSIFWSFVVDLFDTGQGKRLFGLLSAGATLGGIVGSALTYLSIESFGRMWLLLGAVVLLELAVFASKRLRASAERIPNRLPDVMQAAPVGGGVFAGMINVFRSPYLLGIALFILLYSLTSTILYFQQATIAEANFATREGRTQFFANIDLWVNVLTLVCQVFLTSPLLASAGVVATLSILPLFSVVGFAGLAASPTVAVFVAAQVARRVSNFALARPAREVLFTSVSREDRYKAKNFIDTVVYRAGDQIAGWSFAGFTAIGLGTTGIAVLAVPISLIWLSLSIWLGLRQRANEKASRRQQIA